MNARVLNWILGLIIIGLGGSIAYYSIRYQPIRKQILSQINTAAPAQPTETPQSKESSQPATSSPLPAVSGSPTEPRQFKSTQNLAQPNQVETIPLGSNLAAIAQDHDMSATDLAKLNNLSDPNKITANQTIIIPDIASADSYVILYVLNPARQAREAERIAQGETSIYSDPVLSAQSDVKGLFGLTSDTPFSQSNQTNTSITLSTTDTDKIVTIVMNKTADNLWIVKKVTIKLVASTNP